MTKNNFNPAGAFVAVMLTTLVTATYAEPLAGRVVGIADGDTLTLLDTTNTQPAVAAAKFPHKTQ